MQRQMQEFILGLNEQLAAHLPPPAREKKNSLIPVINLAGRPNRKG
jgi:hypothetical protein